MRELLNPQLQLGQVDIGCIEFDLQSRDDIPQLLRGLQYIYTTPQVREEVFGYLERIVPQEVDTETGRPGMELWDILVLGTLRLNLNCDYDRVLELANEHRTVRQMLGHGLVDEERRYRLQTIKDNVRRLTPEVLDGINQIVVKAGHRELGVEDEPLAGRCDSFVVETDVHYPTDINLLDDAMRKVITLCGQAAEAYELAGWRQYAHNYRCVHRLYRRAQRLKGSSSKDEAKKEVRRGEIIAAHEAFMGRAEHYLQRAEGTVEALRSIPGSQYTCEEIERFMGHARRQMDQISRRVVQGEKIPHEEKVFSLFEEHTEWVSKGKAGVPVELGLRVCVVEDRLGFVLHHQVMEQQTDEKVTVDMVKAAQARFPGLHACSFDKGFYTPDNRQHLQRLLDEVVLPKKGKWSKKDRELETEEGFVRARRAHAGVESAINALEVHGLDRCLDHSLEGFRRYVALAVVGRNIQKLGAILLQREKEAAQRKARRLRRAA